MDHLAMECLQKLNTKSTWREKVKAESQRSSRRTFAGCWSCRSRRVKCDERIPSCTPCEKIGQPCAGYEQNLVWVNSDQKTYQHGGRRIRDPVATWKGFSIHDADFIDILIERCDIAQDDIESETVFCPPFAVFRNSKSPSGKVNEVGILSAVRTLSSPGHTSTIDNSPIFIPFSDIFMSPPTLLLPTTDSRLSPEEANLFHHYVSGVAPILIPLAHTGNPWSTYPAIALHYSSAGQKYLLHALLAHAAILRANKGSDTQNMLAAGVKYYVLAMEELRRRLEEDNVDYVGLLTTMMTFLFIELFRGSSKVWRHHYNAAWKFLQQQAKERLWTCSDDAWYATQSFYLLRIMSETSLIRGEPSHAHQIRVDSEDDISLDEFSINPHFGHTIGASNTLMCCISEINAYSQQRLIFGMGEATDQIIGNIRERLEACRTVAASSQDLSAVSHDDAGEALSKHSAEQAHLRAYTAAALIYFYQEFYSLPPHAMSPYVSEILNSIGTFTELTKGNYTIWPLFIAAVEAYEECNILRFQEMFKTACGVGMANRMQIQTLLERIWEIREVQATQSGQERGLIKVDWKNVMHVLEMDVLLT